MARRVSDSRPSPEPSPLADTGERSLVEEILQGDRKATARFVAGHIDALYAYVRLRLTPRTDLVDDVVQDVFVAALKSLVAFRGQSSLRTWMIGIARHKIEDVYRQRLRRLDETDMDAAERDPALAAPIALDDLVDLQRRHEKTHRVLAQLPEQYGLLLLWRYWEQRSTRDMAVALGTTEKSVERSLARARARFKDLWLREP